MEKPTCPFANVSLESSRTLSGGQIQRKIYTVTIAPGTLADEIEQADRATFAWWDIAGRLFIPHEAVIAYRDTLRAISQTFGECGIDWVALDVISAKVDHPDDWEHHFTVTITVGVDALCEI